MRLKIKDLNVSSGGPLVVILHEKDAARMDLHIGDRILVRQNSNRKNKTVAILDITDSNKTVKPNFIGCNDEILKKLKLKHNNSIVLEYAKKPRGIGLIRRKLDGEELNQEEFNIIVNDIVRDELTPEELTYFVSACYTKGLTSNETVRLTKSIVKHGTRLTVRGAAYDKHCIGGVPGNRTTMVMIPILLAAGLKVPKTSSRSITSPAGTADTMEVLAPVTLTMKKMQSMVKNIGGFIAWGGGINLAAADDKLIRVRHSMSIDPEGMLLASILAKKKAVDSNKVLIDIPVGKHSKQSSIQDARHLASRFRYIGKKLDMDVKVIITNGNVPVGNGMGAALEARDVLYVLKRDPRAPIDLENKSIEMAAEMLKMARRKNPKKLARKLLDSGEAYAKMQEIIKAQGGDPMIDPDKIRLGKYKFTIKTPKKGTVVDLNTSALAHTARIAGCPKDKEAGIYLHVRESDKVKKNDPIMTVYADSKAKLEFAVERCACLGCCYTIK